MPNVAKAIPVQRRPAVSWLRAPLAMLMVCVMVLEVCSRASEAAQGASEPGQPSQAAQTPPDLSNWWMKNAASYDPIPTQWLFHTEGVVSFQHQSGNTEGQVLGATAEFVLRKWRISDYFTYKHQFQDITHGGGTGRVELQTRKFINVIRYDFHRWFYGALGGELIRDDPFLIDDRKIIYGGLGFLYSPRPAHTFGLLGALGFLTTDYLSGGVQIDEEGPASYIAASWNWIISPKLTVNLFADFLFYDERGAPDEKNGKSSNAMVSFDVPISKHFALSVGNNFRYEENVVQRLTRAKKYTNIITFGPKFSY